MQIQHQILDWTFTLKALYHAGKIHKAMYKERICKHMHTQTHPATYKVSRESMFLGSLSRDNKDLEQGTLKPSACHSSWVLDKPCYSS